MQRINAHKISGNQPNPENQRSIFIVICAAGMLPNAKIG